MIEWFEFKKKKPTKDGKYLWALNNWNGRDINEQRVHTYRVLIASWEDGRFWDNDQGMYDPDMWAEVPMPEKAIRPTDDIMYQI